MIDTIQQYLPMPYEKFKTLDLDKKHRIIDDIKLSQEKEEKDMYQEGFEKLVILPTGYSRTERERIRKEEAKILGLK